MVVKRELDLLLLSQLANLGVASLPRQAVEAVLPATLIYAPV